MKRPGRQKPADANKRRELDLAHEHYQQRAWADAYQAFLRADQETPLAAEDLERLAMAAYLVGRDEEYLKTLERAYNAHRDARRTVAPSVARSGSAFACSCAARWAARPAGFPVLSVCSSVRRANAPSRAICWCRSSSSASTSGDYEAAYAAAADAAAIGERCGDPDLDRLRPPSAGPGTTAAGAGPSRARAPG